MRISSSCLVELHWDLIPVGGGLLFEFGSKSHSFSFSRSFMQYLTIELTSWIFAFFFQDRRCLENRPIKIGENKRGRCQHGGKVSIGYFVLLQVIAMKANLVNFRLFNYPYCCLTSRKKTWSNIILIFNSIYELHKSSCHTLKDSLCK